MESGFGTSPRQGTQRLHSHRPERRVQDWLQGFGVPLSKNKHEISIGAATQGIEIFARGDI